MTKLLAERKKEALEYYFKLKEEDVPLAAKKTAKDKGVGLETLKSWVTKENNRIQKEHEDAFFARMAQVPGWDEIKQNIISDLEKMIKETEANEKEGK